MCVRASVNCWLLLKFASGEGGWNFWIDFDYSMEYQLIKLHARRILAPPSGHLRHPCPLFTMYQVMVNSAPFYPNRSFSPRLKYDANLLKFLNRIYTCVYCNGDRVSRLAMKKKR